jgi:hypothetical protein
MMTARQGLLPFGELDDQQFEAFVLSMLGSGISLEVIEPAAKRSRESMRGVRYRIIRATFFGGPGRSGQRGIDIEATTETGATWVFQCKHYSSPFGPGKAKSAIAKASEEFPNAERYFLVLSGEKSPEVRDEEKKHRLWEIWGGSELSNKFFNEVDRTKQIEILQRVFPGRALDLIARLYPLRDDLLISADRFFKGWLDPKRIFNHRAKLVGRQEVLRSLHELIRDPAVQAVILPAAGGVGKTRLLRALGDTFAHEHPEKRLFFVDGEARADLGSNVLRVARDGELVVVQDDAHRAESLRSDIFASIVEKHGKMVLATRPHAVDALRAWLARVGVDVGAIRVLPALGALTREERVALARACLPAGRQDWAEALAEWAQGCTLIITVGAELIAQRQWDPRASLTSEEFRRAVFDRLEAESFARAVNEAKMPLARDILRLLAVLAPWNEQVMPLDRILVVLGGCAIRDFQEIFDCLRAARFLLQTRQGWRVVPDLFADHLVYRGCYENDGKLTGFAKRLQREIAANTTVTVLRNLAEAEWQAQLDNTHAESILEPFWRQMLKRFEDANFVDRSQILADWARFSVLQPERSLCLARLAIDLKTAPPPPSIYRFIEHSDSMCSHKKVLGALPPLLEPIATYHADSRGAALDLLWEVHKRLGGSDDAASDSALAAIGSAARFRMRHPADAPLGVVNWLAAKLEGPDAGEFCDHPSPALAVILKPIFEHEVEDNFSDGHTLTVRSWPLSVEKTRGVRTRTLELLRALVIPRGEIATLNALGVLEAAIAFVRLQSESAVAAEYAAPWLQERRNALAIVEHLVTVEQSPRVLFRIGKMLRPHTQYDPQLDFRADCARVLAKIPDSPGLRLTRMLLSNAWGEFFDETPHEGDWVKEAEKRAATEWTLLSDSVTSDILARYPTVETLLPFLSRTTAEYDRAGMPPQGWELLNAIHRTQPGLAADCVDSILAETTTPIDRWWTALFAGGRQFPDERLVGWVHQAFQSDNSVRIRAMLSILGWVGLGEIPSAVLSDIAAWARRLDDRELEIALENLKWRDERRTAVFNAILNNLNLPILSGKSLGRLAEALSNSSDLDGFSLPEDFVRRYIRELRRVDQIDEFQGRPFFARLAEMEPRAFYDMLVGRIREKEAHRGEKRRYSPLRMVGSFPLEGLRSLPDYPSLARGLFEALRTANDHSQYWWRLLFQDAVLRVSPLGLEFLKGWLPEVQTTKELESLIKALHFDGSMIIFRESDFVRAILQRVKQIAPSDFEMLQSCLGDSAAPSMRGYTGHQLRPEFRYYQEEAAKAVAIHEKDADLASFYRAIMRIEDMDAARHQREAELDEAEWQ